MPYTGSTSGWYVGMPVSGTNVPAGATIASIQPGTSITLSAVTTTAITAGTVLTGSTGVALSTAATGALVTTANAYSASATNTFSGVSINAGTLSLGSTTGAGSGAITLNGGSLDAATAGLTVANALTLTQNLRFLGTNSLTVSGAVALPAAKTLQVDANTLTLSGLVSGGFALTKTGAGNLTLSGANTFSGGLNINQGTVQESSVARGRLPRRP